LAVLASNTNNPFSKKNCRVVSHRHTQKEKGTMSDYRLVDDDKVAVASGLALGDASDELTDDKELFAARAVLAQTGDCGRFAKVLMIGLAVLYCGLRMTIPFFLEERGGGGIFSSTAFHGIVIFVGGLMSLFGLCAYQVIKTQKKINHIYSSTKTRDLQPPGRKWRQPHWYVFVAVVEGIRGNGRGSTEPKKQALFSVHSSNVTPYLFTPPPSFFLRFHGRILKVVLFQAASLSTILLR
jgi:hypothetical protein